MRKLRPSQSLFRFLVRCVFSLFYRIRVEGLENIPLDGRALIVPNHVSWIDGFLIMMLTPRPVCMIVYAGNFQSRFMQWWAHRWDAIMIGGGPKSIVKALKRAQEALKNDELVCIFAEGGITRTGQLQAFRPGLMKIVEGASAPVIPVYLDELWGSIFSFSEGKFFRKWPKKWRYPISVFYGTPIEDPRTVSEVRQAVQQLGSFAVSQRTKPFTCLPKAIVRRCKRRAFSPKVADTNGGDVTGGQLLLRTLILRRLLNRGILKKDEKNVGILLPPSAGGVIANMACVLDRRVPIHLNYTGTSDVLNECISTAGIQHVLTSRQVVNKLDLKIDAKVVEIDQLRDQVSTADKIVGALGAFAVPASLLSAWFGLNRLRGSETATVIFTSGSTGTPKGVVLSYDNIASNVEAIEQVVHLTSEDVIAGVLPFFHSFGFTVTLWTPMALDLKVVYHYSPLDAKRIGMMIKKHGATVLLATPTFLRSYVRRCKPEQFKTLDVVVAGAEKLPIALMDAFDDKFGIRPVEGYGCTELSPLVAVNIPPSRSQSKQIDRKEGSVGRPIPGVSAKVVDPATGEDLPAGRDGRILIQGPNVMQGYLDLADKTEEAVRDGWYDTGDIGLVDEEGFLFITGRQSRFSKIGGEMVPHVRVEEGLLSQIERDDEAAIPIAVTGVPDPKKGERLIVLYAQLDKSPEQMNQGLAELGLPNLFIPSPDYYFQVAEIPVLGTGKLDLRGINEMASRVMEIKTKGVESDPNA